MSIKIIWSRSDLFIIHFIYFTQTYLKVQDHLKVRSRSLSIKVRCLKKSVQAVITAHVRSTREGNVLTRVCVSVHTCGEGTPQTWDGVPPWTWDGVPPRTWDGGTPWTWDGVPPPPDLGQGTPLDLGWVTSPDLGWGTPPRPGTGYPLDLGQGTPQTWDWVPLDLGLGTPLPLGWGTPQTWDGVPPPTPPQTWDRVPPRPGMGYPRPPDLEWGTPPRPGTLYPPQHSEHLLRGGRYVSCVHAGGLSCIANGFVIYVFHGWYTFD